MKALKFYVLDTLLAALTFAVAADEVEASTNETKGSIEVGGLFADVTDSPDMAAEFNTINEGPVGKIKLATFQNWGALNFKFKYAAQDQHSGDLDFDIKRMVRSHNTYNAFPHRLGHDPMTNLE